jgi:hypothetical protein
VMLWLMLPGRLPRGQAAGLSILPHTPTEEGSVQGPGVKKGIPRMEMVHYQDVTLELRAHLLAA